MANASSMVDGNSINHVLEAYDLLPSTKSHHIRSALGPHVTDIRQIDATTSLISFDTRPHGMHVVSSFTRELQYHFDLDFE
jgi:hypothetical protein